MTLHEALSANRTPLPIPVICCERGGEWAVAWQQTAARESVLLPLVETRSPAETAETLARHPAAFVVVELSAANLERVIDLLRTIDRRYPRARAAVVAARNLRACGRLMRELGAVEFVTSPRQLGPLVRGARRHADLSAGEGSARDSDQTIHERIWATLPWDDQQPRDPAISD